jgi:hypothetical protein
MLFTVRSNLNLSTLQVDSTGFSEGAGLRAIGIIQVLTSVTVEEIFSAALSRVDSERPAFLVHACAGALALRREVDSLLNSRRRRLVLDGPAVAATSQMSSDTGGRF